MNNDNEIESWKLIRQIVKKDGDFWDFSKKWLLKIDNYFKENVSSEKDPEHPHYFCEFLYLLPRYENVFVKSKEECKKLNGVFVEEMRDYFRKRNKNQRDNFHVAITIVTVWQLFCDEVVENFESKN